jgi:hypothetical protein
MVIAPSNKADALTRQIVLLVAWMGAAAFAALLTLACFRPAAIASWAGQAVAAEVQQRVAVHVPKALVRAAAPRMTRGLIREVRIFSGANALVFLALGLMACFWTRAGRQLLVPASILLGAALLVGCTYVFNQDWLKTILLGDYVGLWYFSYLGLALAFMLDVVFNGARASLLLVEAAISAVGAVFSAAC